MENVENVEKVEFKERMKRCAFCDLARSFNVHDVKYVHDVIFEIVSLHSGSFRMAEDQKARRGKELPRGSSKVCRWEFGSRSIGKRTATA